MQLRAGLPEVAFPKLPFEDPALANKGNVMLMDMSLLQPNARQTFLESEYLSAMRFYSVNAILGFLKRNARHRRHVSLYKLILNE